MDSLHKIVNPSTYACKLCELTYGKLEEKKTWRQFREDLEIDTEFLHRDEFQKIYASKFGHRFEFPIILAQTAKGLEVLVSNTEFEDIETVEDLMKRIKSRI